MANKSSKTPKKVQQSVAEEAVAEEPVAAGWEEQDTRSWGAPDVTQPAAAILIPPADAQPGNWDGDESQEGEDVVSDPSWGATENFTLNIATHSGSFNPNIAKILIYGETGMQKTRLASTFPHVIFLDVDHGMSSVTEQVDTVYVEDGNLGFTQMKSLYEYLNAGDHPYETVVLDTLNEMQRVIMRFTVEEFTRIRRSYGNLPGQSDYGKMLYEFIELTRKFISLPMRVVLLAQVNSKQFDTDILMPQLVGKNTAREILRKMDVVGYIFRADGPDDKKVPVLSFDSIEFVTKDRSNKLPASMANPSYAKMAAYWE